MPAVGAWLASAAFTIGTTAVTWATVLKTAFVIGAAARANSQRKKARRAMLDSIQDRTIMVRSAVADCPIVYGRGRVSGPFRPVGTAGSLAERFSFTVSLAGAIDAIEEVWFGDESIGTLDANGWVTAGRYVKSRQQYATKVVTSLPGSGIITLDHTPDSVASVAVNTGTDNGYESVAFSVAGNQVTISSAYAGMWVNVTYYYTVSTSLARAKGYLGQAGQAADSYLLSEFPSTWTSSHRSDGASYLACTLVYDQDAFPSGIPNVSAIVRGRRVYDPRLDSTNGGSGSHRYTDPTTWEWSRNPALIARDYLKTELGCDDSEIDDATVIAAANACDEWVQVSPSMTSGDYFESGGGKYQLRYTFDGALASTADRLSNLESILMAMVGSAVYSAGKWELQAGVWEAPTTLALDDDDLGGGQVVVQARQARRDLINGVRGNYMHPDKWVVDDFPPYTSSTFVTEDGGAVSIRQIDLPMIRCPYRAQRVAKLMMFQSRQALTMTATWNLGAYEITPTKMVDLTIERYGWTGKDFKCMNRVYDPMGGVELTFKEEAAAIYDWDYNEAIDPDPAPNTLLPDPRDVPDIANLVASSGASIYRILADGTQQPLMRLTWDAVTDVSVTNGGRIEVYVKRASDVVAQPYAVLQGTDTGIDVAPVSRDETYNVMVRAVNGIGVRGAWAVVTHTVSSGAIVNSAGPVAKLLRLVATSQVFNVDKAGTPAPASITLTAEAQNDTSTITWSVITGTATLVGTGNTRTLAYTDMATDYATVQVEQSGRTDFLTIVKVFAGVDGDDGATGPAGPPGADGADGADGAPGERGSLTGYGSQYGISTSSWSDGLANRVINNMLTGESLTTTLATTTHLRIGDMVTLDNGSTWAQMRYWSGIGWVEPGVIIDGNLLVNGTISGDKIAGTTITGSKIAAGTIAAGNMAANSITAANAALANAAVTTAKIADLNVTTLKIGNNAVTVPVSATGGSVALSSVYQAICSVGATLSGAALIILAQVSLDRLSTYTSRAIVQIRIRRSDGGVYVEREFDAPIGDPGASLPGRDSPTIILATTSLSGYAVYYIDARLSYGVNVTAASSALGLIEAKK